MATSVLATALGLHGDNPKKLDLINIDPTKVQQETIAANLANAPGAFHLADLANTFSTEQMLKNLEATLPGFGKMRDQITDIISGKLRGEIPRDVKNYIQRNAAERGISLGTSGSQFNEFDELRHLGLTSLDVQNQGLQQGSTWIRSMPSAPKMNYGSMFFTPQERLKYEFDQAQANKPIEWLNHQIDALPSNVERAAAGFLDWAATMGTSITSMYTGAAMGGMGGMGGGGGGTDGAAKTGGYASELSAPSFSMSGGGPGGASFAESYGTGVSPYAYSPGPSTTYSPGPVSPYGGSGGGGGTDQFQDWFNKSGGF